MSDATKQTAVRPTIWRAVTPHDSNNLPGVPEGLLVVASGNLVLRDKEGNSTPAFAVTAGQELSLRPTGVTAAGTTATVMALY